MSLRSPKRTACAEAVEENAALAQHIIPERYERTVSGALSLLATFVVFEFGR
jgi:hypothetical protein